MQALLTLYAVNDEPPSPGETSTAIEVPVTTQDGVTVIPTEAISSWQVATATDLVTEYFIPQPVETMIESVTRLGQALVDHGFDSHLHHRRPKQPFNDDYRLILCYLVL